MRSRLRFLRGRQGRTRATGHAGGAISLVVILMVPVSTFAAVVAMAVPQRLAAESSLEDSAAALADFAAAWRDAQGRDDTALDAFFGDCTSAELSMSDGPPGTPDSFAGRLQGFCEAVSETVLRDLGGHGFDPGTLRGFYSGSYSTATDMPEGWGLPCSTGNRSTVTNAAHVGLVAHWNGPGWAAAQAMPDGVPMGAEAIGLVERDGGADATLPPCGSQLGLVPQRLAPAAQDDQRAARELAESVPTRFPFAG